jgi:hypothetical protein
VEPKDIKGRGDFQRYMQELEEQRVKKEQAAKEAENGENNFGSTT